MARYTSQQFSVTNVPALGSLTQNVVLSIAYDYINIYSVTVVPGAAGDSAEFLIYKSDTFAAAKLLYALGPATGTLFDPEQNDAGVITAALEGFLTPYEDEDATNELHVKVVNNDDSIRSFTCTVVYEGVDINTGSVVHGQLIVDHDSIEALLVRKDGDLGDIFKVDTVNSDVEVGGGFWVNDNGPHSFNVALDATTFLKIGGAFTGTSGLGYVQTITGSVGVNVSGILCDPNISTAASGTHAWIAALNIEEPNITVNGTAVVTDAATLRIGGAPTEGSNDYALLVASGASRFGGNIGKGIFPATDIHIFAGAPKIRLQSSASGASAPSQTMFGLELTALSMSASLEHPPAVKFGSTDAAFTTTNPKFGAMILGRATEGYDGDSDGGMAIDFATTGNNPGTIGTPAVRMSVDQSGSVGIGIITPLTTLHVYDNSGTAEVRVEGNLGSAIVEVNGGGSTAYDSIFRLADDGVTKWDLFYDAGDSGKFKIRDVVNAANVMEVVPNGNMSFGVGSPTSGVAMLLTHDYSGVVGTRVTMDITVTAANSGFCFDVSGGTLTTVAGTHPVLAGAQVAAPTIDNTASATITNATSLYISSVPTLGTNNYAILAQGSIVASVSSVPALEMHVTATEKWYFMDESDANPGTGDLDSLDSAALYVKGNKFVIAYNNGATMTYITVPMDGSTTTWTHGTGAP